MSHHAAKKIRVFLVDDHHLVLRGLRLLLREQEGFTVCGEALDSAAALEGIALSLPDLAIVDLKLKVGSGFELIERLRREHPALRILVFTMHRDMLYADRAFQAGAHGYVLKLETPEKVIEAAQTVAGGGRYVSLEVDRQFLEKQAGIEWKVDEDGHPAPSRPHIGPHTPPR